MTTTGVSPRGITYRNQDNSSILGAPTKTDPPTTTLDYWWTPGQTNPHGVRLPDSVTYCARWYRQEMERTRRRGHALEVVLLGLTAAIPAAASLGATASVTALLGALAAVGVGLRHIFDWQKRYLSYNRTSGQIEAEVARFLASATPYERNGNAAGRLVCRVESIVLTESDKLTSLGEREAEQNVNP